MKAIHNDSFPSENNVYTVFNTTNIQNESNSQPSVNASESDIYCIQYYKYTK